MSMHILPFKDEFLPQAENLLKEHPEIFSQNDLSYFKQTMTNYLSMQKHMADQGLFLIAVIDKIVYGFIMYEKDINAHNSYIIRWIVVKKGEQNKGYGSKLMHEVIKKIREVGGRHVYLETSNERHNEQAKKFYEDLGFKKIGVLPEYFDHPLRRYRKLEDAILYHKEL